MKVRLRFGLSHSQDDCKGKGDIKEDKESKEVRWIQREF